MTLSTQPDVSLLSLDDPRWRSLIADSRAATAFHDPSWAQLLACTYGYPGFVLAVVGEDGGLVAGAPFLEVRSLSRRRRWVSLPFTDECPPLGRDADCRRALVHALGAAQKSLGAPRIEIRGAVDGFGWRTGADAVIHELELHPDVDEVRKGFSRSQVIRNIARAQREHVSVRRAADDADLDAFYRLHTATRRRQGVPVQPRRFFDLLWSQLVARGRAFILLADAPDRKAVAGALFLTCGQSTIYKFGASDPESLPLRPNHLIFWTAISDACARGDNKLDFGRTDLGNAGLRAFKSGWGARERPLRYSTLAAGAADETEGIASRVLSAAIRNGPQWVCTRTGRALYRYAASR